MLAALCCSTFQPVRIFCLYLFGGAVEDFSFILRKLQLTRNGHAKVSQRVKHSVNVFRGDVCDELSVALEEYMILHEGKYAVVAVIPFSFFL